MLLEWAGYVELIVSELDEDFSMDPHENLHALTIRDAVKGFVSEHPTGLEANVKAWLAPVDERFRGVTDTEDRVPDRLPLGELRSRPAAGGVVVEAAPCPRPDPR